MSVCTSVRLSFCPQGTIRLPLKGFSWNFIYENFSKICLEIKVSLKLDKNDALYVKTNRHFWLYLAQFFLEWEVFQTKVLEEIKTHILNSITIFFLNRDVYEIMWKHTVEPGRAQMTIWRMRISYCITKATDTLTNVLVTAFPLQQCLHERASMLGYTYIAYLVTLHFPRKRKMLILPLSVVRTSSVTLVPAAADRHASCKVHYTL
jgi:hypothetical protein